MKIAEARKLIGTNVVGFTGLWGSYVGVLREVKDSPWRGNIEILAVGEYPAHGYGNGGWTKRRPLAFGSIINCGGANIIPSSGDVDGYWPSVLRAMCEVIRLYDEHPYFLNGGFATAIYKGMKEEFAELTGFEWTPGFNDFGIPVSWPARKW